ncbi:MAG: LacI family transcriptional regulator [Dorea sp.]|nr:LacI family transcriptional regulator [Dorea sp.]
MVSLKDIAVACGVSVASVSKSLNDHSDISEQTKERIRKTAKEMGYLPNSAAKTLKTRKTQNIGVLFVDGAMSGLTHDYFARVLEGFKVAAEAAGYDITFINSSKKNQLSYLEHCKYRGFDGVVVACINFEAPEVIELMQSDIPIVTVDYVFNNRMAVLSDNGKGMRDLVSYICDKGHKKIAYIHGADSAVTRTRLITFYQVMAERGLSVPDEYVLEAKYRDVDGCYEATNRLLDLEDRPTCIIYPDDFASFGGMHAIRERNLSIPEDISIAGYDGIRFGRYLYPKLTTMWQDSRGIGRVAAEKLIGLIERPKTTLVEHVVVEGKIFEGATVKEL